MTSLSGPNLRIPDELRRIGQALAKKGARPVLVGGWVRDALLGHSQNTDFDLEVFDLPARQLRTILERFGPVHLVGRQFGVFKLTTQEAEYDVSLPRRESKTGQGHRGFLVDADPHLSFANAASRRDFTINAMGYAFLEEAFLDPHQGQRDLEARLLRHVGPAFGEDPLRVLRAMQFAARFSFAIAPETLAICQTLPLHELPRERLLEEFRKLLVCSRQPSAGLRYARELGVTGIFPELARLREEAELWHKTLKILDFTAQARPADPKEALILMLAALCQPFGELWEEPQVAPDGGAEQENGPAIEFLKRLTDAGHLLKGVSALLADLDTPQRLKHTTNADGQLRRLALRVDLDHLLRLVGAHQPGEPSWSGDGWNDPLCVWVRSRAGELGVWHHPPRPFLQGRHLLRAGLAPGPGLGALLREAFEQQLDGRLGSREEALDWALAEAKTGVAGPTDKAMELERGETS